MRDAGTIFVSKESIVLAAKELTHVMLAGVHRSQPLPGEACLYYAAATIKALAQVGVKGVLQAGSCSWPRLTPEQDDGKETTFTHFSYLWEPLSLATIKKIAHNELPEMHCWVGLPESQEVIDLTSGDMVAQCQLLANLGWPGVKPPQWFWCKVDSLDWPEGVVYSPDFASCKVALEFLRKVGVKL